ncbi:MAG: tRNA1(Val) (adenine(37)-N6)-methyltransferase [Dongiaceae bacterium]
MSLLAMANPFDKLLSRLSEDKVLNGRLRIQQPNKGYRLAIDPVLLAAGVNASAGEDILDAGCGVGAAGLCLAARIPNLQITGVEIEELLTNIARDNAALNNIKAEFITGDIATEIPALKDKSFDHILTNPPYLKANEADPSPHPEKSRAHIESTAPLLTWIEFCHRHLKPKAYLTIIYRADRIDDLLASLHEKFGGIKIMPLWPKAGAQAKRVIVQARKDSKEPAELLPGLVLHQENGSYTAETDAILREMQAIRWE